MWRSGSGGRVGVEGLAVGELVPELGAFEERVGVVVGLGA